MLIGFLIMSIFTFISWWAFESQNTALFILFAGPVMWAYYLLKILFRKKKK